MITISHSSLEFTVHRAFPFSFKLPNLNLGDEIMINLILEMKKLRFSKVK